MAAAKPAVARAPAPSVEGQGKEGAAPSKEREGAVPGWLASLNQIVDNFVVQLKRREISGSQAVAIRTADVLSTVVQRSRFQTVQQLLDMIRSVGKTLAEANPQELSIGNVVRRVLFIVRQESATTLRLEASAASASDAGKEGSKADAKTDAKADAKADAKGDAKADGKEGVKESVKEGVPSANADAKDAKSSARDSKGEHASVGMDLSLSLHKLLDQQSDGIDQDFGTKPIVPKVKQPVAEVIGELIDEINNVYSQVAEQAIEHIHAKEVIMTYGVSKTVTAFLREAAKFRKFEVIVAESAPGFEGHAMAAQLTELGIECTVITDSAVFAMMACVNKVIVGTHGVMANGGLIAHTGGLNIATAAKHYSVPFVVVAGLYKLCPLYAFDQDTFNEHVAPTQILQFEENTSDKIDVVNPAYDYIAPELVGLYITNDGGHSPSYIYRLLSEYYHPQDYGLVDSA